MRNILDVIGTIVEQIPEENNEKLMLNLYKIANDSVYRAPEIKYLSWNELSYRLNDYIGSPVEDWHFDVYSILTTKTVEQIKQEMEK